ncbi:unnamed protein product [Sphagnum jensenii]|uniref:Uncharacterized protein n=2 Tax=Sphagnum jensenii TaxID=128206 RepID=A0ABP1BBV5_9BRYO
MVPDLELFQRNEDGDSLMRREMDASDLFEEDKENMCVVLEDVMGPLLSLQRSPLPLGYLRSPLQDITAVLSSLNTKEDEDECGRHKECCQRRSQQKLLNQECQPFQEKLAATSLQISPLGQCRMMECSESAGPSESMAPVKQELTGHWSTSNKVAEQSRGTMHSSLMIETESKKQVKSNHCVAVSLHLAKKEHLVIMASNLCNGVDPNSSSSQKMKRRKPFVKLIPGQSVPRFRYPSKAALCNLSQPQVFFIRRKSQGKI